MTRKKDNIYSKVKIDVRMSMRSQVSLLSSVACNKIGTILALMKILIARGLLQIMYRNGAKICFNSIYEQEKCLVSIQRMC